MVAAVESPSCSMVDLLRRVKRSVVGARVLPDRRCVWLPLVVVGPLCPQIPDVRNMGRLFWKRVLGWASFGLGSARALWDVRTWRGSGERVSWWAVGEARGRRTAPAELLRCSGE